LGCALYIRCALYIEKYGNNSNRISHLLHITVELLNTTTKLHSGLCQIADFGTTAVKPLGFLYQIIKLPLLYNVTGYYPT
jgi:hypothetical protein